MVLWSYVPRWNIPDHQALSNNLHLVDEGNKALITFGHFSFEYLYINGLHDSCSLRIRGCQFVYSFCRFILSRNCLLICIISAAFKIVGWNLQKYSPERDCLAWCKVGQKWAHTMSTDELYERFASVFIFKETPSREKHKTSFGVLTTINWICRLNWQNPANDGLRTFNAINFSTSHEMQATSLKPQAASFKLQATS